MDARTKNIIYKFVMLTVSFVMMLLSCIFFADLPKVFSIVSILIFLTLGTTIACLNHEKYQTISKLLIFANIILSIIVVIYIVLDMTGLIAKMSDFETIKSFILSTKQWGILVFVGITVLQVVVLPIPAAVTVLIGVAIYKPFLGFILSMVGTIIGSLIAFTLGKIFGKKLVTWMIGADKTEKYAEILGNRGRFLFVMMLLFPCFPDDILCLVAGITSMSFSYFIIAICLTRPVMIAFYSFFGSGSIIPFSGWGIPVWIAIFCVSVLAFLMLNKLKNYILKKNVKGESQPKSEKLSKTKVKK